MPDSLSVRSDGQVFERNTGYERNVRWNEGKDAGGQERKNTGEKG